MYVCVTKNDNRNNSRNVMYISAKLFFQCVYLFVGMSVIYDMYKNRIYIYIGERVTRSLVPTPPHWIVHGS